MFNPRKIYLIYSPAVADQLYRIVDHELIMQQNILICTVAIDQMTEIHVDQTLDHALLWLEQQDYSSALLLAHQNNISLGFLPLKGEPVPQFLKNLDLADKFDDCLQEALSQETFQVDLIACNGEIVVDGVNLENQTTMEEFIDDGRSYLGMNKLGFKLKRLLHAFALTPHPLTLTTAKNKTVTTAITGMVLLDFHKSGTIFNLYKDSISLIDRRISIVLLAPQSILSYLLLSAPDLFPPQSHKVFKQLGYIRSESLTITTTMETHYIVNKKFLSTKVLKLEVLPGGLKVNAGSSFKARQNYSDDKENVSCDQLPKQEERIKYLSKTLPFFPHALESDFKDLFLSLKDSARTTNTFVLLMILSSLLATLGLFLNSPSVVIGAMVLAPLMSPIISLSMGLLRSDVELTRKSFFTALNGIGIVIILSALSAKLLPIQEVTPEIASRLHPSILDLLVAVLSGTAGAFAIARENIAKSLPGVAIAVALVPPLCVSGIGLGWLNSAVFSGAMLLFLTNFTSIILAAGFSFMILGFAPFSRAKNGIMIAVLLVAMIAVPLFYAFADMLKTAAIKNRLLAQTYHEAEATFTLRNIQISRQGEVLQVNADWVSSQIPSSLALKQFEQHLSKQLQQKVKVNISVRLITEDQ